MMVLLIINRIDIIIVPGDYYSPIDANGRRADLDYRPELNRGCVEFIAPSEYMVFILIQSNFTEYKYRLDLLNLQRTYL